MLRKIVCVSIAASTVLCVSSAQAYQVGETVSPQALVALKVDPQKITVIDFFAAWCGSCRKELPLISALHGRVDPAKVVFIGVDTDENLAVAEAFQKELHDKGDLRFPAHNDLDHSVVAQFKPRGYPALYILKDGKVVSAHVGAMPDADAKLAQDLQALGVY